MARRFNYTKRKRILREHAKIRILRDDKGALSFSALLELASYGFPEGDRESRVFVEAYRGSTASWKRFDFGSPTAPMPPDDRSLDDFGVPEGILFRVRVTETAGDSAGRMLGEADGIPPQLPGEADQPVQPLIRHMPADDIGDEIWRVDFSDELPLLRINSRVPMGVDQFLLDPGYRAVVAPAVMRQVLIKLLLVDRFDGDEEDESDWRQKWLQFAERLTGTTPPPASEGNEAIDDWINTAIENFARRAGFKRFFMTELEAA